MRARFVAAILLTSAVTLAAAAVALLSPLERSLRDDELQSLGQSAQAARGTFAQISSRELYPGSPVLRHAAQVLGRRTEARVAIIDSNGTELMNVSGDRALVAAARRALYSGNDITEKVDEGGTTFGVVALRSSIGNRGGAVALRRSLDEAHSAALVVQRAFFVASGIGLAVAVLLGTWLATTQLRRLRRLRDAVEQIGEHGLESEIPGDPRTDEVADLTRAFKSMQAALRRQEEARKAFVATASHELRTPITSLNAMLELLDDDLAPTRPDLGDARHQLRGARGQSARLVSLARDLLDLSRLDAGTALRREPVELVEAGRAVLAEFELRAREDDVTLALDASDGPAWAEADPNSVVRIVRILMDNALRYSPPGTSVTVTVAPRPKASITVADEGPGVAAADSELVFERFRRGGDSDGDDTGFGLGLAIGRELAVQMRGALRLLNPGERGARFRVELPPAEVDGAPPPEDAGGVEQALPRGGHSA